MPGSHLRRLRELRSTPRWRWHQRSASRERATIRQAEPDFPEPGCEASALFEVLPELGRATILRPPRASRRLPRFHGWFAPFPSIPALVRLKWRQSVALLPPYFRRLP